MSTSIDPASQRAGSLHITMNPAPSQPRPFNKPHTLQEYGARLNSMKRLALVSTALFSLNWFLGICCALSWASTVILGGLLPQLGCIDFYCISALLLLEALRRAAATFFGNLVTRKLIYRSTLPAHIKYDDKDRHRILAFFRVLDQASQLTMLAISIFLSLKRLPSLPWQHRLEFDGLRHSLRIFYILVLLNAIFAVAGVLHSKTLVPWFTTSFSLCRYYDHIVWRGMEKGFLHITDFDFLAFAFKTLADEYRRNLRAPVVYELYGDLIDYIYAHNRGFDAARIAMDSNDHCEQEAAANIVGLWAQLEGAGPSLLFQSGLLTKLADALDHQEIGRAATCSFESLAKVEAEGLLEVKNGRGERLMVILCNRISKAVKVKKEDKALVFIKVLIQLLDCKAGQQEMQTMSGNIVDDLRRVFCGQGCKKRTVGVAGKALTQMGAKPSVAEVDKWLRSPLPSDKEHILEDEEKYIRDLLEQTTLPMAWKTVNTRGDKSPRQSLSYTNRRLCLMSLLLFALLVLVIILCLYKIQF